MDVQTKDYAAAGTPVGGVPVVPSQPPSAPLSRVRRVDQPMFNNDPLSLDDDDDPIIADGNRDTEVQEAGAWYGPGCPPAPGLGDCTTLTECREKCQAWASACSFNLVQKRADIDIGKATFVCGRKGRKACHDNANSCLPPGERRAKTSQYAEPGEELCPFQ
jgi:hypothetical protein